MRLALIPLASLILLHTLPAPARADDVPRYAAREAATPRLAEFRGGCPGDFGPWILLLIPLALVFLPFYLLYKGGEAVVRWWSAGKPTSWLRPAGVPCA